MEKGLLGFVAFIANGADFAGTGLDSPPLRNWRADGGVEVRESSRGTFNTLLTIWMTDARTIVHRPTVNGGPAGPRTGVVPEINERESGRRSALPRLATAGPGYRAIGRGTRSSCTSISLVSSTWRLPSFATRSRFVYDVAAS
jgi:hypothetical protein